jgi:hypothetical protein
MPVEFEEYFLARILEILFTRTELAEKSDSNWVVPTMHGAPRVSLVGDAALD